MPRQTKIMMQVIFIFSKYIIQVTKHNKNVYNLQSTIQLCLVNNSKKSICGEDIKLYGYYAP